MAIAHPALERVLGLLAERPGAPDLAAGYLDLLGETPSASPAQSQRLWTTLAPIYEHIWRPIGFNIAKGWPVGPDTAAEFAMARRALGLAQPDDAAKPAKTVLDVACGPGNVTRALAEGVHEDGLVVGFDIAPGMLARAVQDTKAGQVAYVRGTALELPFSEGSFDAVSCFGALYLFDEPWKVIDQMARVLRPGGKFAILTSRKPRLPFTGEVAQRLAGLGGGYLFGHDEVVDGLRKRGFTGIERRAYPAMQFVTATRGL